MNCFSVDKVGRAVFPDGITEIDKTAFQECSDLRFVEIPSTVVKICRGAFFECPNLQEVKISDGVKVIEDMAFCSCENLKDLTIPDSVESVGKGAFMGCRIDFLDSKALRIRNGFAISEDGKTVFYCTDGSKSVYEIPPCATDIASGTFDCCYDLETIIFPDGMERIKSELLYYECDLRSIEIPASVKKIDDGAFSAVDSIGEVIFYGSKSDWEKIDIGSDNDALMEAQLVFREKN